MKKKKERKQLEKRKRKNWKLKKKKTLKASFLEKKIDGQRGGKKPKKAKTKGK